jgi:hypothetical protein
VTIDQSHQTIRAVVEVVESKATGKLDKFINNAGIGTNGFLFQPLFQNYSYKLKFEIWLTGLLTMCSTQQLYEGHVIK